MSSISITRITAFIFTCVVSLWVFSSFTYRGGDDLVKDVLKHTNKLRKTKGLKELEMRDDLNAIARKHSEDMAKGRSAFGHGGFSQRQAAVSRHLKYSSIAENVAYGPTEGKEVVAMWKGSPGHRKNMLGNYKYTGIGTARSRQGIIYYTQLFVR